MSNIEECWSTNNEDFNYSSLEDLLDSNDELKAGDKVYVGDAKKPKPSSFFDVDDFLESISNAACDVGGEYAEDFPDVTKDAVAELKVFVESWLEKNCEVRFYKVDDVREHILTEKDLADYA